MHSLSNKWNCINMYHYNLLFYLIFLQLAFIKLVFNYNIVIETIYEDSEVYMSGNGLCGFFCEYKLNAITRSYNESPTGFCWEYYKNRLQNLNEIARKQLNENCANVIYNLMMKKNEGTKYESNSFKVCLKNDCIGDSNNKIKCECNILRNLPNYGLKMLPVGR